MSNRLSMPSASASDLDLLADIVSASQVRSFSARGWYAGRWSLAFETNSGCGFHIVGAGEACIRLDDGTTYTLHAGDVALVSVAHVLCSDLRRAPQRFTPELAAAMNVDEDEGETCMLCGAYLFDSANRHPVFTNLPPIVLLRAGQREPAIDALIGVLDDEFRGRAPGARTVSARLIDAMLIYILRHWIASDCPRALGWLRALRDPVLARALALIHNDYAQPWTLDELARASGSSRASLARYFAAEVGTSPMQFLAERRLDVAKQLLERTGKSLDEIAAEVGYGSGFSLSKAFKRRYGEAPRHLLAGARAP